MDAPRGRISAALLLRCYASGKGPNGLVAIAMEPKDPPTIDAGNFWWDYTSAFTKTELTQEPNEPRLEFCARLAETLNKRYSVALLNGYDWRFRDGATGDLLTERLITTKVWQHA